MTEESNAVIDLLQAGLIHEIAAVFAQEQAALDAEAEWEVEHTSNSGEGHDAPGLGWVPFGVSGAYVLWRRRKPKGPLQDLADRASKEEER